MGLGVIGADWQDPGTYAAIAAHGRPGLVWELLRRDPAYRAAFAGVEAGRPTNSAFVARWGLHFP